MHLGYSDARAAEAVARAQEALGEQAETAVLIREARKGMAR
jgi:Holliday junction resolvasome RuvABC DNA-binding subunit